MPPITKRVIDFTAHNVSSAANYNQASGLYPTLFTGKTVRDGSVFAIDASIQDDSQNASSPMVISKESVRNLMPAGWAGRICCHFQAWWGIGSHPDIGFSDRDPATMTAICNDFKARGYDVFIPDWYHPTKTTVLNDNSVDIMITACAAAGLKLMVMIDQQYFDNFGSTTATYQADLITAINHLMDRYAANAAYEKVGGRPLLLLWGIDSRVAGFVNWNTVRTAVTSHGNPLLIHYQASGFSVVDSDGALAWEDSNADAGGNPKSGVTYLRNSFLPAAKSHPTKIALSSVCKGFNGTMTRSVGWSQNKYLDQQGGQTWLEWWQENSDYVAGGGNLYGVATLTADDFQEGTPVQCGIRTDVKLNATLAGNVITFSITGNENTVRQYNLWGTLDGDHVTQLATVLPGAAKQFDLGKLPGLTQDGTYTLYIECQSKPSLQNHMAPQTFTQALKVGGIIVPPPPPPPPPPPDPTVGGPIGLLTADTSLGNIPLTVNFDGSQSYDLNTTIATYRFDFGDGTAPQISAVQTATHTYTKAGTFLASLTVTDSAGAVGVANVTITVKSPDVTTTPGGGLPPPPPPPPPLPTGDPLNPIVVTTPSPVPTPDPRRSLCQRFRDRLKKG